MLVATVMSQCNADVRRTWHVDEPWLDAVGQLYNLKADPQERVNLYRRRPEIVARLTALLKQYQDAGRSRPKG